MQQTLTKTNEVDKLVKQTVLDMGYSSKGYLLHPYVFLCSNKVDSTFHQPQAGPPFSPEREIFCSLPFAGLWHSCVSSSLKGSRERFRSDV